MSRPSTRLGAFAFVGSLTAGLLLAVATLLPARSADESTFDAYLTLVERFCTQRGQALRALSRWSPESLERVGQKLHECGECHAARDTTSRPSALVDAECGCESPPWAAAAVLHTVRAFTSGPSSRSQLHLSFASRLQEMVGNDDLRRRWYLTVGLASLYRADPASARSYLSEGLERFEDDPDLLVALGASYEVDAWRTWLAARNRDLDHSQRGARVRREQKAERSGLWASSADLYRKALARDPDHPEAHLRLGRVELLRGHPAEGLENLRWVEENAGEPDLIYLAHLFAGREQARSGQLDAALASYRAALEADPRGQAAYVATSHALQLRGDPEAAAEVLEHGLAARRRTRARDAWWRYPEGRPEQLVELLTGLHEQVCR